MSNLDKAVEVLREALSDPMTDDEFHGLTVELCELRDKLDGYYGA